MIPDVVVFAHNNPVMYRHILDEPPLLCIEVVSLSQRPEEMLTKCPRYIEFGVQFCWVVDPVRGRACEHHALAG